MCLGSCVLALVAARARRSIYLVRSWPCRALNLLGEPPEVQATIMALKHDYTNFVRIEKLAALGNKRAKILYRRSVMKLLCVEQITLALRKSPAGEWVMHDGLRRWLMQKSHRLIGSIICEDGFNVTKNANTVKGKRRFLTPAKASHLLISERVRHCPCVCGPLTLGIGHSDSPGPAPWFGQPSSGQDAIAAHHCNFPLPV